MAPSTPKPERRTRWGRRLILGLLGFVVVACLAIVVAPTWATAFFVERILTAQGLGPVTMDVRRVGLSSATIADLKLGEGPDLTIETLEVAYDFRELLEGQLRDVVLDGVSIQATAGELSDLSEIGETFSMGVLDRLVADLVSGPPSDGGQALPDFALRDGVFRLDTPGGFLEAAFYASADAVGFLDMSVELTEQRLSSTRGLDVEAFTAHLSRGADQRLAADLDILVRNFEGAAATIKDAQMSAAYREPDVSGIGSGMIDFGIGEILIADVIATEEPSTAQGDTSPFDAFVSEFVIALRRSMSPAAASGRIEIERVDDQLTISADQPLLLAAPQSSGATDTLADGAASSGEFRLSASSDEESGRLAVLRFEDKIRLQTDLTFNLQGPELPAVAASLTGDFLVAQELIGQEARIFENFRISRLALDVTPWTVGDLTIGARDLSLTLQGTAEQFAGRVIGDLLIDGPVLQNVAISQGALGLAGRFTRDLGGLRYTQASDACVQLATNEIKVNDIVVKRPQFSMCANKQEPLIRVVFGEGLPLEVQLNTKFPSEYSLIRSTGGFELEGRVPEVALYAEYIPGTADWRVTYGLSEGEVDLAGQVAKLEDLRFSGQASGRGGEIAEVSAYLDGVRITDPNELDLYAPLSIQGELSGAGDDLTFLGQAFVFDDIELAKLDGTHNLGEGLGRLNIEFGTIEFGSNGFKAESLFPVLNGVVADVEGQAIARGLVEWSTNTLTSSGRIELKSLDLASAIGPVKGIGGDILLDDLVPPSTPEPQKLTIDSVDIGLELVAGELEFSLDSNADLVLEGASWPWAGGQLGLDQSLLAFETARQDLTLTANDIDLQQVFTLLDVEGLSGTGVVSGNIPVFVEDGTITIVDGRLASSAGGGTIKYDGVASDVGAQDDSSTLLFDALKDFTYDKLEVVINGRTTDVLTVAIQLNGSNPTVLEGFPIKLNVNAEAPLVELIRQGTVGYRVPDEIQRRLLEESQ